MSAVGGGLSVPDWFIGLTGAGWDPIFEYDGETYAEMDKAKKNTLSHRAVALSKLRQWLQAQ